jgi:hypothetical protein
MVRTERQVLGRDGTLPQHCGKARRIASMPPVHATALPPIQQQASDAASGDALRRLQSLPSRRIAIG